MSDADRPGGPGAGGSGAGGLASFEVLGELGRGGLATVFRARHVASGRLVALKRLNPEVAADPEMGARVRHEAEVLSRISHPNVVRLLAAGPDGPGVFLAMELADAGTLGDLLARCPRLPVDAALLVARDVLRGLAAVHAAGALHRDLKPQNVLLFAQGRVAVGDLGVARTERLARLTSTGNVVGTPAFMSPEQALGEPLDARSDLFPVGVMLHEMLAGRNPFLHDTPATTMRRIVDLCPPPLGELDARVPAGVESLAERLLAKSRELRPATAAEAAAAVDRELAKVAGSQPEEVLARLLSDPAAFVRERASARRTAHLLNARELRRSGTASVEIMLWEAVQALAHDPESREARELVAELAHASGYRVERRPPASRGAHAAARAAPDPDDPASLLRMAKAAKLEHDYLRLMRLFFRLRELDLRDPYLVGQTAALVARPREAQRGATPKSAMPSRRSFPFPPWLVAMALVSLLLIVVGLARLW